VFAQSSCRKQEGPAAVIPKTETPPEIKMTFDNRVGIKTLTLKTEKYTNEHGDTFSVNSYRYYISNISLLTQAGVEYNEAESYHLVDEGVTSSKTFSLANVPEGDYVKVRFMIGVDSARNVSGAQTGALDPIHAMFWNWNTGYIMAKMEGTSPQTSKYPDNLGFHIGGFTGIFQTQRWVTLTFPITITVAKNSTKVIHLKSDLSEWFKTPVTIDFSKLSIIAHDGVEANMIADNYADMFSIDHID
jgi:hypothetical protein